jgi:2-polyprenyl-3-methyl-5-hydroxy-6-metoxy-1,4-benzoquinol methylase
MKEFWLSTNIDNAGDRILTGYLGALEDMPIDNYALSLLGQGASALDFGCGVGRYSSELANNFEKVFSYDLPNMISLVPQKNKLSNITYTSDWQEVISNKFDLVLASLVFQHIDDHELTSYLSDIANITDKVFLISRSWIDDTNSSVLDIVQNFFDVEMLSETVNDHFVAMLTSK